MEAGEGYARAEAFFQKKLPKGTVRYVGGGWQSFIDSRAEFCFERHGKAKREFVCIVLNKEELSSAEEALDRTLEEALTNPGYSPCRNKYESTDRGRGSRGLRKWQRC